MLMHNRRICEGNGGHARLIKFGRLRFFGQRDKFGQSQFLKRSAYVSVFVLFCFVFKIGISYFKLNSAS